MLLTDVRKLPVPHIARRPFELSERLMCAFLNETLIYRNVFASRKFVCN